MLTLPLFVLLPVANKTWSRTCRIRLSEFKFEPV